MNRKYLAKTNGDEGLNPLMNITGSKKHNGRVHNNQKVTTVKLYPASYYDDIRMRRPSPSI